MIIQTSSSGFIHPKSSEITPRSLYENRREVLKAWGASAAGAALSSLSVHPAQAAAAAESSPLKTKPLKASPSTIAGAQAPEKITEFKDATTYNNFYEFGTDKSDPARHAKTLRTQPWTLEITGAVKKPLKLGLEDLLQLSPMQERIYRLRCVEGWSMVIPWIGYSLSELIRKVEPLGKAKYLQIISLADPTQMNGLGGFASIEFPYVEGLRLDEAMHPLTLLVFGMYGQMLPNQNGAPLRLMSPWKYGFKGGKSIVQIRFTEHQPPTTWSKAAPQEYGFYSNVNPQVDHPRWSQSSERRIGDEGGLFAKKRKTLLFNGYEPQVGQLYTGMDLKKFF